MPKKPQITIKQVKGIPEELVEEFIRKTPGAGGSYYRTVLFADLKLGAFHKGKLIGFMVGTDESKNIKGRFGIDAPYVKEEFRRQGIGSRMLFGMLAEAKKRGFTSAEISNTTLDFDYMAGKAIRRLKKYGIKSISHDYYLEEDEAWWCIDLKKPPKRPLPKPPAKKPIPRRRK